MRLRFDAIMSTEEWETYVGTVERRVFAPGSKSERATAHLIVGRRALRLRRRGGRAYGDKVVEALVGKTIECSGRIRGETLFMSEWKEI